MGFGGMTLVLLTTIGCGSGGGGPQRTLDSFAQAINRRDGKAVLQLVCRYSRSSAGSNTLADPFATTHREIDLIDPRLRGLHYAAKAGDITGSAARSSRTGATYPPPHPPRYGQEASMASVTCRVS